LSTLSQTNFLANQPEPAANHKGTSIGDAAASHFQTIHKAESTHQATVFIALRTGSTKRYAQANHHVRANAQAVDSFIIFFG